MDSVELQMKKDYLNEEIINCQYDINYGARTTWCVARDRQDDLKRKLETLLRENFVGPKPEQKVYRPKETTGSRYIKKGEVRWQWRKEVFRDTGKIASFMYVQMGLEGQ